MTQPIRDAHDVDGIENFVFEARAYLMPIKAYSDLLLVLDSENLTPEQRQMIHQIQHVADTLTEACAKLLTEAHERHDGNKNL